MAVSFTNIFTGTWFSLFCSMLTNLPLKILITVVIISLLACYGIRCVVFTKIKNRLPELLQELEQRNITAKIASIETSWYENRISLKGISISNQEPNSLPLSIAEASISSLTITGVELLPLLISKRITIDSLIIGKVKLSKYQAAKTGKKGNTERSFHVNYVSIDSLEIVDLDSLDKTIRTSKFNFETKTLSGTLPLTSLHAVELSVNELRVTLPNSNYTITSPRIVLENMSTLRVDTLSVIPAFSKREFVRRAVYETDRIACVFPSIELQGINFESMFKNELAVHMVKLGFVMDVYRDKRIKDRKKFKPLPDSLLRQLPFAIVIDSIRITQSQLSYEEFAEKADSSGRVYFKNLEGALTNISNRDPDKSMDLVAHAQFMNDGDISVYGTFSNSKKPHFLAGSLKNFRLSRINGMLKPATGLTIESGRLELLKFSFWYNDDHSDGELSLNYHDLRLLSLRENKKDKKAVQNVFKTILINAFVENDLDGSDPRAKRKGTIHFVRDQNKFVFNFWWKSLLSGLKSASKFPESKKQSNVSS